MSVSYISNERNEIEDKGSAGLGIEEIAGSSMFDSQRFWGIRETPRMYFAEERGRESGPVN
jgi:hypothetical protein